MYGRGETVIFRKGGHHTGEDIGLFMSCCYVAGEHCFSNSFVVLVLVLVLVADGLCWRIRAAGGGAESRLLGVV